MTTTAAGTPEQQPPAADAIPAGGEQPAPPAVVWTVARFMSAVAGKLGDRYRTVDDGVYIWLTPFGDDHATHARQAHYALRRLPEMLPGFDPAPTPGHRWPAILLASTDDLLAYEGLFGGSGDSIIHGGCWRRRPVGHLAIPVSEWDGLDAAFGHELVHAILDESGIPRWLQEGITTELETRMGNRSQPLQNQHNWRETLAYWRTHDPADFWSGQGFRDPASSEHAYRLAQVIGYRWTRSPERLQLAQRLRPADWDDEQATLATHFQVSRDDLLAAVLTPGGVRKRGWLEPLLYWCFVGDPP